MPRGRLQTLELLPPARIRWTSCEAAVSALGCVLPERPTITISPARATLPTGLMASLGSMLLYWHHYAHHGRASTSKPTTIRSAAHFLHLLHGTRSRHRTMRADALPRSILYAEHEFNASTFTARSIAGTGADIYSAITGAHRRRCAGPSMAAPTRSRSKSRSANGRSRRRRRPTSAAGSRPRGRRSASAIPVYTDRRSAQQGDQGGRARASVAGSRRDEDVRNRRPDRGRHGRRQENVRQSRLVQRGLLPRDGRYRPSMFTPLFVISTNIGVGGPCDGAAHQQQNHPSDRELCRPGKIVKFVPLHAAWQGRHRRRAPPKENNHGISRWRTDLADKPAGVRFRGLLNSTEHSPETAGRA